MLTRILAAVLTMVLAVAARADESEHHSHPAPERLGTVRFATTCSAAVKPAFGRALALLHSFTYTLSEQAFRDVAQRDPGCAIAHWGIAMSRYHQLWEPPSGEALRIGAEEARKAVDGHAGSLREREFIESAAVYYQGAEHESPGTRAQRYALAMADVAHRNPRDDEAQIFYALALIATASPADKSHANQRQAADILEPIFARHPEHPGLAHYLIHAYDSAELAPRGVAAARAYSRIAPSAPHALHMPSHVFTRLGLWEDSITSNRAARAAAHAQGDLGEELHAMDYLTYAYLQRARYADAEEVVREALAIPELRTTEFKVDYPATAMPVRLAIERRDWAGAVRLEGMPGLRPSVASLIYWARAIGNSRGGHPREADADVARLEACVRETQSAGDAYWGMQVATLLKEARAWRSAAAGDTQAALADLIAAADEEDAVEKLPVTPGPVVPAREQLGELLLDLKRPADALREFKVALTAAPGRRGALLGSAQAAEALGDAPAAGRFRAELNAGSARERNITP